MRATENNAKGTSGQSFTKALFEELGWSAVSNPEHDLGTDLWVGARDSRRVDLGALVGVQVKNYNLPFDKPELNGEREGWWFPTDGDHIDYWLNHRIPHLLALFDKESRRVHWEHITSVSVVSTGKGYKIFVPKDQTLDDAHLKELVDIATRTPVGESWEGSAWIPGQVIPEDAQLRYSAIAPRLIRPHPNMSAETVTPAQALAMLTSMQIRDIRGRYESKQPLLDPDLSLDADEPAWRLYAASSKWILDGATDVLRSMPREEISPHVRAAHLVLLASMLYEQGDVREVVSLIESDLESNDDYNPVDFAWINLHLARGLSQSGQSVRARAIALEFASIGQIAPNDPTARMLSGVATELVLTLSDWGDGNIKDAIQARDTAASWWRSQTMTTGLAKSLTESFRTWSHDQSVTYGAADQTRLSLRSAALMSGFAADTPNWSLASSLLARHILMSDPDANDAKAALNMLRISGAANELKLAVSRLLEIGPIEAVKEIAESIDLDFSTRTSLSSDLELLRLAGPVVSEEVAGSLAHWLLDELGDPDTRPETLGLSFSYPEHLVKTLSGVYVACSSVWQGKIRDHIADLPVVTEQSLAHQYANLLENAIEEQEWSLEQIELFRKRSRDDNFELSQALEAIVASRDPAVRQTLVSRIADGDGVALYHWGDVRDLPTEAVKGMILHTDGAVIKELESARSGAYSYGSGDNLLSRLVLLNVWYPDCAKWDSVIEVVKDPSSSPNDLAPGLAMLTYHAKRLPESIKTSLREPIQRLAATPPDDRFGGLIPNRDIRGAALVLLVAIAPDDVSEEQLVVFLQGSPEQVAAAIKVFARREKPEYLPLLGALALSESIVVQASVAAALAEWAAKDVGGTAVSAQLTKMLMRPGVKLALQVTRAIADHPESEAAAKILLILADHQSAIVRRHVEMIRDRWSQ